MKKKKKKTRNEKNIEMEWASVNRCLTTRKCYECFLFQLLQVVNSFTTMVNMHSVSSFNNQRTFSNDCWTTAKPTAVATATITKKKNYK